MELVVSQTWLVKSCKSLVCQHLLLLTMDIFGIPDFDLACRKYNEALKTLASGACDVEMF